MTTKLATRQSEQSIRTLVRMIVHEEVADILAELNSPKLQRSIRDGRKAYTQGKTIPYEKILDELNLD